jgi:hypothetical protein
VHSQPPKKQVEARILRKRVIAEVEADDNADEVASLQTGGSEGAAASGQPTSASAAGAGTGASKQDQQPQALTDQQLFGRELVLTCKVSTQAHTRLVTA